MSRKSSKKSEQTVPPVAPDQKRLAFLIDEGTPFFINAWTLSKTSSGLLLRAGCVDPIERRCLSLLHLQMPIVAVRDVAMSGETPSREVMTRWASIPADVPDPTAQFSAYLGTTPALMANGMVAAVSPVGGRLAFQWIDPQQLGRKDLGEVRAVHVVTLRAPPEVCGRLWLAVADLAAQASSDRAYSALRSVDARFGEGHAAGSS